MDPTAGTTRDRHYGKAEWTGTVFSATIPAAASGSDDVPRTWIREQVRLAIDEADTILFLVDVHGGVTVLTRAIAEMLRRVEKPCAWSPTRWTPATGSLMRRNSTRSAWARCTASARQSGAGTGDLLDVVVAGFHQAHRGGRARPAASPSWQTQRGQSPAERPPGA